MFAVLLYNRENRARRQSGFPTFISCQRHDVNVLPKRRQSHQGDKLCDVSTVPLVARWPVFLARGSDADGEPHCSAEASHDREPLYSISSYYFVLVAQYSSEYYHFKWMNMICTLNHYNVPRSS